VAPIDLHLFTGQRFEAQKRLSFFLRTAQMAQIIAHDGDLALKAIFAQPLQHNRRFDFFILLKPFVNQLTKRVQF